MSKQHNTQATGGRCQAAHPDDPTPCAGPPDAMRIIDAAGEQASGCVHHGAVMLASLVGARVYPGSIDGAAIAAYRQAQTRRPFGFGPGDPGPVPPVVEPDGPQPTDPVLVPLGDLTAIRVEEVTGCGTARLTVAHGTTAIGVTLTPAQVDELCAALVAACPVPYGLAERVDQAVTELTPGGAR
jgi:hypothetical protein